MDAREMLQNLAKSNGFNKGAAWMYDNALMFIKGTDPHAPNACNDWQYVRVKPQPDPEYEIDKYAVVRGKSWEDIAAKVYRALDEDSLYVRKTKIDKNTTSAAKFMINCVLNGLA